MSRAVVNHPLSVALVGFGEMGQNHARCLASMKEVELVAVVDPDEDRRNLAAARYECESFSSATELPEVGAAVVAVPTAQHSDVGCFLMKRGVHCLIEKPLALDRAEAKLLVDLAESENLTLQVGHIERFNPAVRQLGAAVFYRRSIRERSFCPERFLSSFSIAESRPQINRPS